MPGRAAADEVAVPVVHAERCRAPAPFVTGDDAIASSARSKGIPIVEVDASVMRAIADTTTPQGVVAVVTMPERELSEVVSAGDLILVLADVRDPGNAGTLLRSATAAGASAVVFTKGAVDPFSPKTVRAAAGTGGRLLYTDLSDPALTVFELNITGAVATLRGARPGPAVLLRGADERVRGGKRLQAGCVVQRMGRSHAVVRSPCVQPLELSPGNGVGR